MALIAKLDILLGANTTQFQKQMKGASGTIARFTAAVRRNAAALARWGTILGGAVAAGVTYGIKRQMTELDALGKTAAKLGIATDALEGLHMAAARTGVESKTFDMGLQRMVRRVAEAGKNTGEAVKALKDLKVVAKDIAQLSPDEQFKALARAMENVPTHGEKIRLAFKLFDSEGVALVNTLALGADGIDRMMERARRFNLTLSTDVVRGVEAANDSLADMKDAFRGVFIQETGALAPLIKVLADDLTEAMVSASTFTKTMTTEFGILGTAILAVVEKLQKLQEVWIALQLVTLKAQREMKGTMSERGLLNQIFDPNTTVGTFGKKGTHYGKGMRELDNTIRDLEDQLQKLVSADWARSLVDRVREDQRNRGTGTEGYGQPGIPVSVGTIAPIERGTVPEYSKLADIWKQTNRQEANVQDQQLRELQGINRGVDDLKNDQLDPLPNFFNN